MTVSQPATGRSRTVETNEFGDYLVPFRPSGDYRVSARYEGLQLVEREGIRLLVNQRARVDIVLPAGDVSFSVIVTEDAPLIEMDSSSLGAVIDDHKVKELPLNGRDFFELTYIVAGAVPGAEESQNSTQGGAVAVNGMREQSNNFLLDGVDNNNQFLNQLTVPPPVEAVQEFKIQSGVYGAEFGSRAGAQLNVVTRSGTNQFRATLYNFHRNAALDTRNFFDPSDRDIPRFVRNQFGMAGGGPIVRDRTFFFATYEGLRETKGITRLATVPPSEFIEGDFSSLPFSIINPFTQQPFPDNRIPREAMSPTGAALAGFYPAPNSMQAGGNLLSQPLREAEVDQFLARVDHRIGESDSLLFRYAFWNEDRFDPFDPFLDPTSIPGFGTFTSNRGQNVAFRWNHVFSAAVINDLSLAYNRAHRSILHENVGNDITSAVGISGFSTDPRDIGFPATQVVGFDSLVESITLPLGEADNTYQILQALSWQIGGHSYKVGIDARQFRSNGFLNILARGEFHYTGAATNHPVADLLLGLPTVVLGTSGDTNFNLRTNSINVYFQDNFKVSNNFTVNYGVPYEYNQPARASSRIGSPYRTWSRQRRALSPAERRAFLPAVTTTTRTILLPGLVLPGVRASRSRSFGRATVSSTTLAFSRSIDLHESTPLTSASSGLFFRSSPTRWGETLFRVRSSPPMNWTFLPPTLSTGRSMSSTLCSMISYWKRPTWDQMGSSCWGGTT